MSGGPCGGHIWGRPVWGKMRAPGDGQKQASGGRRAQLLHRRRAALSTPTELHHPFAAWVQPRPVFWSLRCL